LRTIAYVSRALDDRSVPPEPLSSPDLVDRGGSLLALRLAIGKDGLGIELARGATLGCLDVVELVVRLPRVRFPFDVTGGVAKFRHRRGELERLAIEIDARRAARHCEPLLRGLLGTGACQVAIALRAFGATITILSALDARALAFEVSLLPGPDVALVVHDARGANLPGPATTLALRAAARLWGDATTREGCVFSAGRFVDRIARALLPDAGLRAPSTDGVLLVGSGESDGVLHIAFARGSVKPTDEAGSPIALAALAKMTAGLTREADDARFADDLERARRHDVAALERAPGHPQIARRIAEIDRHAGGRAEAAVATLRRAERMPYVGTLLGDLLFETGDRTGAIAALVREGEREPSAAISALAYARAARYSADPNDALEWLDRAVARMPTLAELRWERGEKRLARGRIADARADFQELEAMSEGSHARYTTLRRAADIHRAQGLRMEAAALYERALLYRPDDAETLAGLGAAIAAEGRPARGATLLVRAIEIAGQPWMELELAKILADRLGDRPAAIARIRSVPDEAPEATEARGLEGRWRAALGDLGGASLAFARLRERAGREAAAVPWLDEAARFEETRGELARAQVHLGAALAIEPANEALASRYRAIGEAIAQAAGVRPPPEPPPESAPAPEEDEARIEALTQQLQGDPSNDRIVDELVLRLTRLGRSMELLALLSARLEDAPPERRDELLPRHREVLERLETEARAAGRDGEADLFKMARDST
jgi:cellulose synthase operon protein C